MAKLKPKWVKTDIPKEVRIKLWRLIRDTQTFDAFQGQVSKHYDEIFAGVSKKEDKYGSFSRDTYNALKYEIMHMPIEEIETLPKDLQFWVQEIRPQVKGHLNKAGDEKQILSVPNEVLVKHWNTLVITAEELEMCLRFPEQGIGKTYKSRTGGTFFSSWLVKDEVLLLSVESNNLIFGCLLSHLDAEFASFSEELTEFKEKVVELIEGEDAIKVVNNQMTQNIRDKLEFVVERGNFKGTCDICKDWY